LIYDAGATQEEYTETYLQQLAASNGPYNETNSFFLYDVNPSSVKVSYLSQLQTDYEFADVHFHGAPTMHLVGPANVVVQNYEIRAAAPKPLFYNLASCSLGKFDEEGYVAGEYVFAGNGLLATAITLPGMSPIGTMPRLFLQKSGVTFGTAFKYDTVMQQTYIGDVSLQLRKPPSNPPVIQSDIQYIEFGQVAVGQTVTKLFNLRNLGAQGAKDLVFNGRRLSPKINGIPGGYDAFTLQYFFPPLSPSSEVAFPLSFTPTIAGEYTGRIILVSNDPSTPYYPIIIHGQATSQSALKPTLPKPTQATAQKR